MSWSDDNVRDLIATLRDRGGDLTEVEVKRARGGTPTLGPTLSAFGNMPDGGTIVLGLDEANGFAATGLDDPHAMQQAVAAQARQAVVPPLHVDFQEARVDGATILLADVTGLPLVERPCCYRGRAYLRQADGDYELAPLELQQIERAKLAGTEHPHDDVQPVDGTTIDDLDPDLKAEFLNGVRGSSARLAAADDVTVLRRKAAMEPHGERLTMAGLVALGQYPQQFAPSYAITAAVRLPPGSGARTRDLVHLDGPLPDLLDHAMDWVRRNTATQILYDERGHARDELELPARAVRELIANALVHRDLGPMTEGKRVEIRLTDDNLIITSPGGLRGITVRQLGDVLGKSAVNQYLYEIAKFTRIRDGARVIEGEGGGIREVRDALDAAGMNQPVFHDTGVAFVARISRHALIGADDLAWLAKATPGLQLTDLQRAVLVALRNGDELTNGSVRRRFRAKDRETAQTTLQGLVETGLVERVGSGRGTSYRFADVGLMPRELPRVEVKASPRDTTANDDEARATSSDRRLASDLRPANPGSKPSPGAITTHGAAIFAALDLGRRLAEITERTGLTVGQARYALKKLTDAGLVRMHGAQGHRDTTYVRRSDD